MGDKDIKVWYNKHMKKQILIIAVLIVAIGLVVFGLRFLSGNEDTWLCQNDEWVKHGNPLSPAPAEGCGKTINSFGECDAAGYLILESYPSQCVTPNGEKFVEDIGNELEKADLIKINNPRPNQTVKSPIIIEGQAKGSWFFEASFPIKLFDANGNQLATAIAQAQGDWMTMDFVPFKAILEFVAPATDAGNLILEKDNPSGLPQNADQLRVPVKFEAFAKSIVVKAYFNNSKMDPKVSCNKVFPVDKIIFKTSAPARAALEELLKGPTKQEKADGFFTSINPGVKIEKLTIDPLTGGGTAKVEFDEQLEFQVGGSCRVSAIRAQIVETLKQFSTIKDVVISINGRTEDILQP